MTVIFEIKAFIFIEAAKCFISLNFVIFIESHRSLWNNMAIVFNCSDMIMKSINFLEINLNNQTFWIFFFCGSQLIFLSSLFLSFSFSFSISIVFLLNFFVNQFWVSAEELC